MSETSIETIGKAMEYDKRSNSEKMLNARLCAVRIKLELSRKQKPWESLSRIENYYCKNPETVPTEPNKKFKSNRITLSPDWK